MMDICTPQDFVVIKIDIDKAPVELAVIGQSLRSPKLLGLINELFFEQHVIRNPIFPTNWDNTTSLAKESYFGLTDAKLNLADI